MATFSLDDVDFGTDVTPSPTPSDGGQYTLDDVDFGLEEKSLAPPPPPEKSLSEKFKDLSTVEWGGTTPSGAPTNTFDPFEAVGSIFGLAKKPVDWLARESSKMMGLPVSEDATTGQLARAAMAPETPTGGSNLPLELLSNVLTGGVPIHQMIENVESPHLRALIGAGVERGTEFATDPAQIAFAGKALPKAAHYAMTGLMGHGVLGGGAAFYDEVKKNGFSPKALEHLATLSGDAILLALGNLPRKKGQEGAKDPEVRALLEEKGVDPDLAFAQALEKAAEEPPPAFKGTSRKESLPEGWSLKPTGEGERVRVTSPEGVGITYPNEKAARKGIASERKKIMVKPPEPETVPMVPELLPGEEALPNVWGGEVLRGEEPPPPPPGIQYKSQLSDLQQTPEEIAAAREGRMTPPPPIDVDPTKYIPSRERVEPPTKKPSKEEIQQEKERVRLIDEIQKEQEKAPNAERFREAQKQVQEEEAQAPPFQSEMAPPPEGHLTIEMKATIQEAIETGFNAKTSIKQIQEKLNIPEEQARELYWKTKRALQAEKRGGHLPLEEIPLKIQGDIPKSITKESLSPYLKNPQLQKLHRFITNAFEPINKAVEGRIPGEERVLENNYRGFTLKPGQNAFRVSAKGNLPEHIGAKGVGDIYINPWSLALEARLQERSGAIPKGTAHRFFVDRLTEALGHEPAHARARHGEAKVKDLFTGEETVDPFNAEKMSQDFSFDVADQSVRNSPEFNRIMEGIKSPNNDVAVREMYDSLLKDAREIYKDIKIKGGAKSPEEMAMKEPTLEEQNMEMREGKGLEPPPPLGELPSPKPLKGVGRESERGAVGTGGNKPINVKAPVPPINLGGHKPSSPTGKGLSVTASPSLKSKVWEEIKGISGAVRVITVGGDVSSPLRQSWIQTAAHPIRSAKNLKTIFRGLSEKGYERVGKEIEADPYYQDAVKAKAAVKKVQEEQYEGIKYLRKRLGKVAASPADISERGYNIYLRKTRMESFSRGMELLEGKYGKGKVPDNVKEGLARWVNTSTGRGNVARKYEAAFSAINQVLFSPRLLKSRLDTFNPREWQRLYRADPIIRNMAVTELVRAVAFMGSMVGTTAAITGAKVEGDPRSADFGKLRIGNTSIDPWGGYQPYIRLAAQIATRKRKTQYGDIQDVQIGDLLQRFARSKLAPLPGFAWTALEGKTFVGDRAPLNDMKTYWDSFGVMTIRDIVEISKQDPELAVALAVPIALGVGTTTRPALPTTKKVQDEYRRLKIAPPMDVESMEDFSKEPSIDRKTGKAKRERRRLSNEEFKEVKKKTDPEVWREIEKYVSSDFYQKLSDEEKTIALHKLSRKMGSFRRKRSRELLMKPPPTVRR